MEQKDKRKEILIVILVLVAVIDLVLFALCLNKNTTISFSDVGIWVGTIGTIAAIYFVVRNTNKQIDNQNKQMHRPYLVIRDIIENMNTLEDCPTYLLTGKEYQKEVQENGVKSSPNNYYKCELELSNIGDGIAINIYMIVRQTILNLLVGDTVGKQDKKIH